jgi:hypothetical protein
LQIAGAQAPRLGSFTSEETRAKLSASMMGKNNPMFGKTGENHPSFGKTRSEEARAKMSASKIGNSYGKNQPHAQKIEVTDLELDTKTTYSSIKAAARDLNLPSHNTITNYFSQNGYQQKPYKGRFIFTLYTKRLKEFNVHDALCTDS